MLGGGEAKIAAQHAADKLTARERLALLIDEGTFVELGIHGRPALLPAGHGRSRGARRRRHHRLRQGQRPPHRRRRLRLHRDGGIDGHDRRAEGHPAARAGAEQADPAGVAAGLRRRADPGGRRVAVRRLRAPVPRGGRHERRHPAGGGADGPVRGGDRLHPGPGRLRPHGQGPRLDGPGRAPSGARGRGRGRHPGGARRLARALPQVRGRRPRGGRRPRLHRADQALPELLPAELRGAAADRRPPPIRWTAATRSCSTCCRSPTASPTTCTR